MLFLKTIHLRMHLDSLNIKPCDVVSASGPEVQWLPTYQHLCGHRIAQNHRK